MTTGIETVLIADDEEIVIGVGRQMLERLGYSVLTAKNGLEAVDIYRDNQNKIGLVILDLIMPGLEAGDTYDKLRALNPAGGDGWCFVGSLDEGFFGGFAEGFEG